MVSIIVLNKDKISYLKTCIESVLELTTYKRYEIVIVENNSTEKETFAYYETLKKHKNIRILEYKEIEFNYQKIINFAVKNCSSEYIVQLNNDTKLLTPNWLELMIGVAKNKDVGAVGCTLYFPDNTIQHAGGFVSDEEPYSGHINAGMPKDTWYSQENQRRVHEVTWVTGACLMSRRSVYEQVGYMDEQYRTFYGDVDFCLKLKAAGLSIMMQPKVEFIHYEGITRGYYQEPELYKIYEEDKSLFTKKRVKKILIYNPSLYVLGGGEKYMGYLCQFLEEFYPDAEIDILTNKFLYDEFNNDEDRILEKLTKRFDLHLNRTKIVKIDIDKKETFEEMHGSNQAITDKTAEYDLFINFMFLSKQQGKAKKNVYICMFPPKPSDGVSSLADEQFIDSYDMFIPISEFSRDWLIKYWGEKLEYKIIYPPVFKKQEAVENYDEAKKENIILSVGRFFAGGHCKKQLELVRIFIKNIKKLKDYELHLAGGVSDNPSDILYVDEIKTLADSYPVFIHTNAKTEEITSLFEKAKIFWHATGYDEDINIEPYKAEHFGITTVEAMSNGAVPVVINKGGQPEIVDDGIDGYLWNNESECIKKTCILINDEKQRVKMAKQAIKKAENYTVESFNKRCKTVFEAIKSNEKVEMIETEAICELDKKANSNRINIANHIKNSRWLKLGRRLGFVKWIDEFDDSDFVDDSDNLVVEIDINEIEGFKSTGIEQYISQLLEAMNSIAPQNIYRQYNAMNNEKRIPDIVHSARNEFLDHPSAAKVYTLYDLSFLEIPETHIDITVKNCMSAINSASQNADMFIAISEHTKNTFLKHFPHIKAEKVHVIPLSYRKKLLESIDIKNELKSLVINVDKPFWLFVGTLEPRKNITALIRAYIKLHNEGETFPLYIAGKEGWLTEEIHKEIEAANIGKNLRLLGYVTESQLATLYKACYAVVYPSLYEGFGLPILEAMSLGAAVITSNTTSMPEVGGDTVLYVDPHNIDDIYEKMKTLQNDKKLRDNLGKKGKERAINEFSWEKTAILTLECYQEAIRIRKQQENIKTPEINEYKDYVDTVFQAGKKSKDFVEYKENNITFSNEDVKPIACYLTQFHTIPENDKWWGKGFTEWTNVTKAVPHFPGHYQPHLPLETFYDLSDINVMKEQVKLAKNYGIYGFMFHFYWFKGKRLLEKPFENYLNAKKDLDFPFCVNWANHSWTRIWDSSEDNVLLEQTYSEEDDLAFIKEVSSYFSDKRYIRVNGKPIISVNNPGFMPDINKTIDIWRDYCRKNEIGEIHIIGTDNSELNPLIYNLDGAIAQAPHDIGNHIIEDLRKEILSANGKSMCYIYDMEEYVRRKLYRTDGRDLMYRGIIPTFDNSARRIDDLHIFDVSPKLYKEWLSDIIKDAEKNFDSGNRFVFINAWNEWAEGAHLEPDRKYGYAFLQATADAVLESRNNR
ncbi:MAG: glycoside hydrolase family 99-like domain-containing protein [Oscillospiraceae bacterium]|jgi:glycosyltransferase involved in cell wall biosynthesis|nr:glycoside hydrolase family 99-like domain-containing protein [Oscillospiraceae bacterium]